MDTISGLIVQRTLFSISMLKQFVTEDGIPRLAETYEREDSRSCRNQIHSIKSRV